MRQFDSSIPRSGPEIGREIARDISFNQPVRLWAMESVGNCEAIPYESRVLCSGPRRRLGSPRYRPFLTRSSNEPDLDEYQITIVI